MKRKISAFKLKSMLQKRVYELQDKIERYMPDKNMESQKLYLQKKIREVELTINGILDDDLVEN